jgi:hypothetical protein
MYQLSTNELININGGGINFSTTSGLIKNVTSIINFIGKLFK